MSAMETLRVRTTRRCEMVDVTESVDAVVERSGVREGIAIVQSLHTTAAVTVNENADPDVQHDLLEKLERLAPRDEPSTATRRGTATAT